MAIGPIEAVRVFVSDLAVARAFYADVLGLGVIDDDAAALILDTGQARLIVERGDADDPETQDLVGRFAAVSFAVADAHAECRSLSARGVRIVGWPEQQAWGGILAHIADPDGKCSPWFNISPEPPLRESADMISGRARDRPNRP